MEQRLREAYEKFIATTQDTPEETQAWDELVAILFGKCEPCEP